MNKEGKQKILFIISIIFLLVLCLPLVTSIDIISWLRDLGQVTGLASSATTTASITIGNNAPNITNVSVASTVSITEAGATTLYFYFLAKDPDGLTNLNVSSAQGYANITIYGETNNRNNSNNLTCDYIGDVGQAKNFSCIAKIYYWDANATWSLNASICDLNNACTQNISKTFALGVTGSIQIAPNALTFGTVSLGASNTTATNHPMIINNSGNLNVTNGNVQVTAIDLAGANTKTILAGNFSVGTAIGTAACDYSSTANKTINNTAVGITFAGLPRGNLSQGGGAARQNLTFCLFPAIPAYLTAQSYDTTAGGPWTIGIV